MNNSIIDFPISDLLLEKMEPPLDFQKWKNRCFAPRTYCSVSKFTAHFTNLPTESLQHKVLTEKKLVKNNKSSALFILFIEKDGSKFICWASDRLSISLDSALHFNNRVDLNFAYTARHAPYDVKFLC